MEKRKERSNLQISDSVLQMTLGTDSNRWILVLPPHLTNCRKKIEIFALSHPSNIRSKKRLQLAEIEDHGLYELRTHRFSKGCLYNEDQDQSEGRYHHTKDGQTVKSTLITNETNPEIGYVMEEGGFRYLAKYDITFSLIGFFYKEYVVGEEKDYLKEGGKDPRAMQCNNKFVSLRDYHDLLIDTHDPEWSHVSFKSLRRALENVAEIIDEAGDIYYKITPKKITECLVRKVRQILENFPSTLPLPLSLQPEMLECAKIFTAVNLLISLVPKSAYWNLAKYSGQDLNISEAFRKYRQHKQYLKDLSKEKELLVQKAMSVGLPTHADGDHRKKILKKPVVMKKVVTGKGAIDSFFKRAK